MNAAQIELQAALDLILPESKIPFVRHLATVTDTGKGTAVFITGATREQTREITETVRMALENAGIQAKRITAKHGPFKLWTLFDSTKTVCGFRTGFEF